MGSLRSLANGQEASVAELDGPQALLDVIALSDDTHRLFPGYTVEVIHNRTRAYWNLDLALPLPRL